MKSPTLTFNNLNETDLASLFQIYKNPLVSKYRGSLPMKSLADAKGMIDYQLWNDQDIEYQRIAIRIKKSQQLIGTLLLKHHVQTQSTEVGFSFGAEYWGQGYATETLQSILNAFKNTSELKILQAWVIQENHASNHIFQKAGFVIIPQNLYPESNWFQIEN